MGVDIVEVDVQRTKDGQLIIMHDESLDRTTDGTGKVWQKTFKEIQHLRLKDGLGIVTEHKIPTLKEVLVLAKGKVLINVDKGYNYFHEVFRLLEQTGTTQQTIIKGWMKTYQDVRRDLGENVRKVNYMPIVDLDDPKAEKIIKDYRENLKPCAYEFNFKSDTLPLESLFMEIKASGARVWVNSLWPFFNGGHHDERAVYDLDGSYGWLVKTGANMIQTDRPKLLIEYLGTLDVRR